MLRREAIELLGGTVSEAAAAIGITSAAVSQWPEELPDRIRDRVQAALWRRQQQALKGAAAQTQTSEVRDAA